MAPLTANDRQRRIIQLSEQWGIVLPPAPARLTRPAQPPSFRAPGDDQLAEDLLQRHAAEVAQLRPKSGISRAFSTNNLKKGKHWDPREIIEVLNSWVANCGSPGVAEALLVKLSAAGVDLNGMQKGKSGILNRRRSLETFVDRTRLLRTAVERDLYDMVQVLLPHADPLALDACIPVAIKSGSTPMVEVLLQYGANAAQTAEGQDAFRRACSVHGQSHMISLILQSDGRPSPSLASQSMTDAAKAGCLETVLCLSRSVADGNYNDADALKVAVHSGRRDIAVAIAMGNKPPQNPGLNGAFQLLFNHQSLNPNTKLDIAELLLCAGAQGDALSQALERACASQFFDMVNLLSAYGVSIEYKDASVLKKAVSQGQLDLVGSLLTERSTLSPALASSCVPLIPKQALCETRYALLSLLLQKGAGGDSLSECLIDAVQAIDYRSAELLLNPFFPEDQTTGPSGRRGSRNPRRHQVASPDYKNGEALRTAVLKADVKMTEKILLAKPSGEILTSVFPLTKNLSTMDRYQMVDLFLKGALSGSCLHAALQDAINEDISQRDDSLIKLLLEHDADVNYNDGAGLEAVILQKDISLLSLLVQKASPQTAAARIQDVMRVDDHRIRHDMLNMLLRAGAVIGVQHMAVALKDTLSEKPVDMSLLRLLLQYGKADVNALEGAIVQEAVRNPDPKVLELVLNLGRPTGETLSRCLDELSPIPSTEGKTWKLKAILSKSNKTEDLSGFLVNEIQALLRDNTRQPSLSTLKLLLESGADPNAYQAAALCHAVAAADTQLSELLFECNNQPSPASLSSALPHALRIPDLMDRITFAKKLVDAGAFPKEVNRALIHAIKKHTGDFALVKVLACAADASDGEALALAVSKESPETVDLLLIFTKHTQESRNAALEMAMKIRDWTPRIQICRHLLTAGVSPQAASNALLTAARDGDLELGDALIAHGASISNQDGQAVIEACRGGSVEVLDVLLKGDLATQKITLERGFQAATEIGDLNKRAMIFKRLLHKGVTGEVVDAQLISAARYGEGGQEVLRVLLAAGADPNYSNGEAVYAATRSAFVGNLELLLGLWHEGGNQVSAPSHDAYNDPSAYAASQKKASPPTLIRALKACWMLSRDIRLEVVQDLMKAGMPATEDVHKALNKAVNEEDPDERMVKLLLDVGASPLANGCQTLIEATRNVAASSLRLLLQHNILEEDINRTFSQGFTAENFSVWFSDNGLEVAQLLLDKGAKGDALSGALIQVIGNSDPATPELSDKFVELLVAHGVDVDYQDGEALKQAASKANAQWARKLLECHPSSATLSLGFQHIFDTGLSEDETLQLFDMFTEYHEGDVRLDVMASFPGQDPVLIKAISQFPRSTKIVGALLDAGFYHDQITQCNVHADIEGEEEVTLLMWAIAQPQKKVSTGVIQMLIERGANVNFESKTTSSTPVMLAIQARRPDVVKLLLLEGAEVDVADSIGRTPLSMATNIGGDIAIQLMGNLLAAEPSKDDGSLHNAARELNLSAVRVLIQAGHDPDFPSPLHDGRSALGEICLHASDMGELTAEREKAMQKVMSLLVEIGSDLTIKSHGKSLLHLCFDAFDPLATTRVLLKVVMWKHVNKTFNHFNDGEFTYSPTMYIKKLLPPASNPNRDKLLALLQANRATDVYYANDGDQPEDAVGLPEDLEIQERERKARLRRIAKESEDHSIALARKREVASVEQQIWANKAELEDARRRRLHGEDLGAIRAKSQLEESLSTDALKRRLSEQRALTDASLSRTRAIASTELDAEETRQRKMFEWEGRMNTERVDNARALSALRISEREEVERIERGTEERIRKRLEAQRKVVESQEKLAKRLAAGPGGGVDARRQIGYVEELN